MTNSVAKETTVCRYTTDDSDHPLYRQVIVWCPGCDQRHHFTVELLDPDWRRPDGQPEPVWQWDGNLESPTFSPSMLAYYTVHLCDPSEHHEVCEDYEHCEQKGHLILNWDRDTQQEIGPRVYGHNLPHTADPAYGNCHSFLRNGVWEFLGDCAHSLAGQKVPMVPLPDWVVKETE